MVQKRYSKLTENIFSLLTLRVLEYVLAFILVPYLIRTLGPMNFGAIAFMQWSIFVYSLIMGIR